MWPETVAVSPSGATVTSTSLRVKVLSVLPKPNGQSPPARPVQAAVQEIRPDEGHGRGQILVRHCLHQVSEASGDEGFIPRVLGPLRSAVIGAVAGEQRQEAEEPHPCHQLSRHRPLHRRLLSPLPCWWRRQQSV